MLTILRDPAGVTGIARHPLDFGITLQANIERHLSHGGDAELRINGQTVDPLTDPRLDAPPSRFDRVTVVQRPAGFDPLTLAVIAIAASVAISYALIPDINTPTATKESPNNGLTGQTNIARTYQAIPDIYGLRRVWPDLIQPSAIEYIDHIKYVTEYLCVGRGRGTITNVQYAETSIVDVAGATFEVFEPSFTGPTLPGSLIGYPEFQYCTLTNLVETFAAPDVNGQEMAPPAAPVTAVFTGVRFVATSGSATFTLRVTDGEATAPIKALVPSGNAIVTFTYGDAGVGTDGDLVAETCAVTAFSVASGKCTFTLVRGSTFPLSYDETAASASILPDAATVSAVIGPFTLPVECNRIRWNTIFPRGLKGTVNIEVTWEQLDSGGSVLATETDDFDYIANTADGRYFTTEVTPAAGQGRYRIRFKRTTAEIGSGTFDLAKLEAVYATRYYATRDLPGVTVIKVTTKATEQATGFSDRKFNLRWNRHVRTLTTDTLSASRNFARAMAHIWKIAGKDMAELDTTKLAAINTEFGETDDLLRFDYSFDDRDVSLGERLQIVANHARCVVWRDGTKWTVTRDQARQYPELQFDYRNLAAGGDAVISVAAHLPASFDGLELEYVDETTQSAKAYIRLDITSGSVATGATLNPKKIQLPGCTTEAQAENRARLEARKLLYQRTSIQDTALADAMTAGVGALVRYIDPNDFAGDDGLQAGEVMSIDGTTITTSEALDFGAETSGRILFTGDDGARLAAPVVCTPNDDGSVELASVPAGLYVRSATRQLGSRYAFAVGLTEAETEAAGLYLLTEVRPNGTGTATLSLASYDARIYADD
jgi:hypothetical protein